jgi:predicted dehydrogenase
MEKPPGADSRETRELIEIAEARGTPNQVAFNRRHAPTLVRMKTLLGEASPFWGASCQFYRYRRAEDAFAFGTGLHGLDALRFLGDSEVCEVRTHAGVRSSAHVTLVYESGALATMEMLPEVGIQSERYTAHAGERTVFCDGAVGWLTRFPGFLRCYDRTELTLSIDNADQGAPPEEVSGFYGEAVHFATSLRTGRSPEPDLATSLRSVEIAETVQQGKSRTFR